jgi:regulatory protein
MERDALGLLGAREHSRLELVRKLRARGHGEVAVGRLLDDLSARGLLSEERMAAAYVAERLRKGFGPLRVRQELRQRGVADAVIEPHLDRTGHEWLKLMAEVHDKKYGATRPENMKERARRARFLEYRGFPAALIARYLDLDGEA